MGIPDSFDPLMFLSQTNTDRNGSYTKPGTASDTGKPSVIPYTGDGTAQLRSAAQTKHNTSVPSGGNAQSSYPANVDQFDPINLSPGPQKTAIAREGTTDGAGG